MQPIPDDQTRQLQERIGQLEQTVLEHTGITHALRNEISTYQQSMEALTADLNRYRQFFLEDLAGIFITTPDGALEDCNPACAHIFGFDSTEAMKQVNLSSLYAQPHKRSEFLHMLQRERKLTQLEMELLRADGTKVHAIGNVVGEFDGSGKLIRIKGYLSDITERKKLERQFLHSQKMEAVGRLAGSVAHDFNNLLTVVKSYAELLIAKIHEQAPYRKYAEEIRNASDRATWLAKQLLMFSHRQITRPQVLNLNSVITSMEEMLRRLLGADVELTIAAALDPCGIKAEAGKIEQVVMNLVVNARDAMPEGGRLTITTGHVDIYETFIGEYADMKPGSYVMMAITDTGCGMNEETKNHIFEPFFTTKGRGKGTGLGLSTVYGILKQYDGYIHVYSEAGYGTTFRLYFPRHDGSPAGQAQERKPLHIPAANLRGSETVLVVEDEDAVRELCKEVLELMGYTVLTAKNADEALRIFHEHTSPIDLLLTDMIMPRTNGNALAEHLQDENPAMKVLYMSGHTESFFSRQDMPEKHFAFLSKPFSSEELTRRVREVLEEARTSR